MVKKEANAFIKNMNGNGSKSNMHSLFLNDTERTLIDTVLETCNGNGSVQSDGTCECDDGYAGNECQYSRQVTCNGNGNPTNNGENIGSNI